MTSFGFASICDTTSDAAANNQNAPSCRVTDLPAMLFTCIHKYAAVSDVEARTGRGADGSDGFDVGRVCG